MELDNLLREGIKLGASDIHLTVGVEPTLRVNGGLKKIGEEVLSSNQIDGLIKGMMNDKVEEEFRERGEADFAYHLDNYRFRVNAFQQRGDAAAVLRIIPNEILSLNALGLPKELKDLALTPRGLFLVTGPTGSGKSTTLASMIDLINRSKDKHIITLEDPIEYVHQHKKSIVNQREVGEDTENFANGLRAALRQDPDVILVGEMRDLETISTAITAAETGHLVFATLHTNSAAETIDRIINVFPPHQQEQVKTQLALTLKGVLSQQLLPTIDDLGRAAATELLVVNSAVSNLVREGKTHQLESIMQTSKEEGMHTMDYSLRDLYRSGKISRDEALSKAINIQSLKRMI
ncbi:MULTISPECIES: type IV pilus twitching motility protein PilT [unclassified Candidatus Frackibacter]|uniref:type IV pilus twitching motility protein PilT n=1 Tax=unclassified Candidatus Frackibacter TaxID=2648818 RepID=UPI0008C6288C|nr:MULTISPECIES: type IV pilus twitching motility protein PilT [unclassified Candidatus Frackibacter]SEM68785.1 twitching motility protein PilT [Candidatus Frackibacter sp. WG12]SFL80084.1 twitching motility protein PilT [Candidatus Frackibacter sp. WG13]